MNDRLALVASEISPWTLLLGVAIAALASLVLWLVGWGDTRWHRIVAANRVIRRAELLLSSPLDKAHIEGFRRVLRSHYVFEQYYALGTLGLLYERFTLRQESSTAGVRELLPACQTALAAASPFLRCAAAQALARAGRDARFATHELVVALTTHPHEGAGMYAATALGQCAEDSSEVREALLSLRNQPRALAYESARRAYEELTQGEYPEPEGRGGPTSPAF